MNNNNRNCIRHPQNLLITGGCGFIGVNFIHYLLSPESGFTGTIVNIDKLTYAAHSNALVELVNPRYIFIYGDICDSILIKDILYKFNIDTICHFAAESHVDRSINNGYPFIQSNINGTFSLLEIVRQYYPSVHFHHISTDEVFGSLEPSDAAFTELAPYAPNNPYSASKASSDHLVRAYAHTYNLSTTMSHSSNNYGLYQHEEKLIPQTIRRLYDKKPIPLYGDGSNIRDWIHVSDHVRAIWTILCYGNTGENYNIGARNEYSNRELLQILCKLYAELTTPAKNDIKSVYNEYLNLITLVPDRPGHDLRYAIDPSKIEKTLYWYPQIPFEAGLKALIVHQVDSYQK
ncbi:dTDP-glucose 4,6-dehydratase [Entomospira nematocerorum]|uniref:dTDP-glucose 4,6-dehydratase n=1 Tax=Entomospira nematocerorum TaxID=2719987 RepID=A0A968KV86_9SPIO|nr:dTDP-glucose 4,6-dehydratase [Entomospira nematocera]NIZ47013.1 dTDP-glucose 4,6-dehydratase [Entomospira nematocera]WDI34442.1 dTDP-glucose 4,6-dehydratase [Entomospira nematocera]